MNDPLLLGTMATTATVAIAHTLLGPDHYLPLLAYRQQRGGTRRRLLGLTVLCGTLHCLTGGLLALLGLGLSLSVASFDGLADLQSMTAGALWATAGLLLLAVAVWRRRRATRVAAPASLWLLLFTIGPCEWLVPSILAAAHQHGALGGFMVWLPYTLLTVATMAVVVLAGERLLSARGEQSAGWLQNAIAGVLLLATGACLGFGL